MRMHLGYHGGHCCGIKTIRNLGVGPDFIYSSSLFTGDDRHVDGTTFSTSISFFKGTLPKETNDKRLVRLIYACEEKRKHGIIEVVVSSNLNGFDQHERWKPVLEKLNFKLVNSCLNSNTGNTIFVYHRNSGEVPKLKNPDGKNKKKVLKAFAEAVLGDGEE